MDESVGDGDLLRSVQCLQPLDDDAPLLQAPQHFGVPALRQRIDPQKVGAVRATSASMRCSVRRAYRSKAAEVAGVRPAAASAAVGAGEQAEQKRQFSSHQ